MPSELIEPGSVIVQPNVLDQNCESRQALDRIADKWTCLIVYALLRRAAPAR